jgi:hypothetical protein
MEGTLLIRWEKGYAEKRAVVTDVGEEAGEAAWYQMRFWIEDEYKDHKSGGWGWEQTKMSDPKRGERLWLAMAVAMQLVVLVGGREEAGEQEQQRRKAGKGKGKRRVGRPAKPLWRPRGREVSCLVRGQHTIKAAVIRGEELPTGHVVAEAWPKQTFALGKPTRSWVQKCQRKEAIKRHRQRKQTQQDAERREEKRARREQKRKDREAKHLRLLLERAEREQEREQSRQRKQQERARRKREQAQKPEERRCAREAREQERVRRQRWHEEIQRERERRLQRKQERAARQASAALADQREASGLFGTPTGLVPPPAPP